MPPKPKPPPKPKKPVKKPTKKPVKKPVKKSVVQKQTQKQNVVVNITQPAARRAPRTAAPKASQNQGNVIQRMIRMNEPPIPIQNTLGGGVRVTEPLKPIEDYSQFAGVGRKSVPKTVPEETSDQRNARIVAERNAALKERRQRGETDYERERRERFQEQNQK
tara:strand:- start:292 stop:780 length:489 start_codon:yes stop_codon:yes gene_type:complete